MNGDDCQALDYRYTSLECIKSNFVVKMSRSVIISKSSNNWTIFEKLTKLDI